MLDINKLYDRVRELNEAFNNKTGKKLEVWIEPGRFLVGDCGILLCRLTAKKRTP